MSKAFMSLAFQSLRLLLLNSNLGNLFISTIPTVLVLLHPHTRTHSPKFVQLFGHYTALKDAKMRPSIRWSVIAYMYAYPTTTHTHL